MQPIKLIINDFKGHKNTEIDFTKFNTALILGSKLENDDISNGTGKSTIFHTVVYALFGEYDTKTIEKIVRRGADKACVIFEFLLDNVHYKIQRSRSKKSKISELLLFKLVDGKFEPLDGVRTGDTETTLRKLIKINYAAFKYSVFFNQGDISGLPAAKDSRARFAILEEIFNLSEYSKLEEYTKKVHISELNKEILILQTKINGIGNPSEELILLEEKLNKTNEVMTLRIAEGKKQETLLANSIIEKELLEKSVNNDISKDIIRQTNEIEKNISQNNQRLQSINNNLGAKKAELERNTNDNIDYQNSLNKTKKEYELLLTVHLDDLSSVKERLKAFQEIDVKLHKSLAVVQHQIHSFSHILPKDENCPECKQNVSEEYRTDYALKTSLKINDLKSEAESINKQIQSNILKKDKTILEIKQIEEHNVKLLDLSAKIDVITSKINDSSKLIAQSTESIKHFENEKLLLTTELSQLELQLEKLREMFIGNASDDINKLNTLDRIIKEAKTFIASNLDAMNTGKINIGIINSKITEKKENIKTLKELALSLKDKNFDLSVYQEISLAFGQFIPKAILYSVLEPLQAHTLFWMDKIRPELKINFRFDKKDKNSEEMFEITYSMDGVDDFDYEDLSGAQKFMVNMAFKIGTAKVIQELTGTSIALFGFDEVDERLDKAASESFYQIIKELEKDHKILVISHRESLKNKFNNIIEIEDHGREIGTFGKLNG